MEGKKFCKFCGAILPVSAKYCTWCGKFVTSPQPNQTLDQGEPPYLEDEILDKLRGLILPVTGKKILLAGVIFVVLLYSAGIAGGWFRPQSQTTTPTPVPSVVAPSSTPKPTSTPKASASQAAGERDEKAVQLEDLLRKQGKTVVTPFTKHVNTNGNDVYTGTFEDSKYAYNVTIEVCKSSADSASRYNEQVAQLKSKGFSTYDGQESKELWLGYNASSKQSVEVKRFTGTDKTLYLSTMFAKKQ